MEGHGASPAEGEVDEFILAVRTFLQANLILFEN